MKYSLIGLILILVIMLIVLTIPSKNPTNIEEKHELTDYVTKQGGTEPAFQNEYWNEKHAGIYVDVNTGKALFSSTDKYDSGTGWPSFTEAIDESLIEEETDNTYGMQRTEIKTEESHLGHVFNDGPDGGDRYCVNSAALMFIPYNKLDEKGYGEYKKLFSFQTATFAGGCFWGVEHLFAQLDGVISATSGYTGGTLENPSYKDVSSGKSGHAEAVQIKFDPNILNYRELVDYFWRVHDPTQLNKQGFDTGTQYRSAIFYYNEEQKQIAEESKAAFDAKGIFNKPAVTEIVPAEEFYVAEEYHQDYYEKNTARSCHALRDE